MLPSLALRTKEMRQLLPEQGPTSESRPLLIKSASPIRAAQTQHPYRPPAFSKARTAKAQNGLGFFCAFLRYLAIPAASPAGVHQPIS